MNKNFLLLYMFSFGIGVTYLSDGNIHSILVGFLVFFMTCVYILVTHPVIKSPMMIAINYIFLLPLPILSIQFFSLGREFYTFSGWNAIKLFNFNILDYLVVLIPVYVCLGCLCLITEIVHILTGPYKFRKYVSVRRFKIRGPNIGKNTSFICISALIIFATGPIYFWMSENGIGITGLMGPSLPFKLSGILYYTTRYVIPLMIIFVCIHYASTVNKRIYVFFIFVFIFFTIYIATLQASRFIILLMGLPLLFLLFQKGKIASIFGFLLFLFGLVLTTLMRSIRLVKGSNDIVVLSSESILQSLLRVPDYYSFVIDKLDFKISNLFLQLLGRLESPQSLVLSSQFDTNSIGGSAAWLLKLIHTSFVHIDADKYHNAWIGAPLPMGFVSAPGFISKALILYYNNLFMWFLWICWLSFWIVLLDKCYGRLFAYYQVSRSAQFATFLLVSFVFCSAPGTMRWYILCIFSIFITFVKVKR